MNSHKVDFFHSKKDLVGVDVSSAPIPYRN